MPSGMRRGWQLTGTVMLLICIYTIWAAHRLALFDRLGPGPGFFPFWLAIIGAVLCAIIVAQVTLSPREAGDGTAVFPRGQTAWLVLAILLASAIGTVLLDWLGFRLSIMIFSALLLFWLGERRWWALAIFSVIAGFGLFHVFNNWLDVILPVGVFGI